MVATMGTFCITWSHFWRYTPSRLGRGLSHGSCQGLLQHHVLILPPSSGPCLIYENMTEKKRGQRSPLLNWHTPPRCGKRRLRCPPRSSQASCSTFGWSPHNRRAVRGANLPWVASQWTLAPENGCAVSNSASGSSTPRNLMSLWETSSRFQRSETGSNFEPNDDCPQAFAPAQVIISNNSSLLVFSSTLNSSVLLAPSVAAPLGHDGQLLPCSLQMPPWFILRLLSSRSCLALESHVVYLEFGPPKKLDLAISPLSNSIFYDIFNKTSSLPRFRQTW